MANRFTDTQKWKDPWFRGLAPDIQRCWIYLCDDCDHAGIWKVDMETLNYFLRSEDPITLDKMLSGLNNGKDRCKTLAGGRIWLTGFVEFQYKGGLNEKNNAHRGVVKQLRKHHITQGLPRGWSGATKGLTRGWSGAQVKDKDKDKDKDSKYISNANKIIDHFNKITESHYKHSDTARRPIIARLTDGFTGPECCAVIDKKWAQWQNDEKMIKFMRIETLFAPTKFEGYLNEKGVVEQKGRAL